MEDDDTDFDQAPAAQLQPVKRKLSRLKRAQTPAEQRSTEQHSPAAALSSPPQALSDRTNIAAAPQKSPAAALSPTETNPAPVPSPAQSPQSSPSGAANSDSDQPEQSESHNDYWDSEDELEAELTRREKAEGFHADSAASAGMISTALQCCCNSTAATSLYLQSLSPDNSICCMQMTNHKMTTRLKMTAKLILLSKVAVLEALMS